MNMSPERAMKDITNKILPIDIESTGLGHNDKICSVGISWPNGKRIRYLVNPRRPIPSRSTEIHGITDDDVRSAPVFWQAAPEIAGHIQEARRYGMEVCVYGNGFDQRFLVREFLASPVDVDSVEIPMFFDVLAWAKTLKLDVGHKLGDVARHFGVKPGGHEADMDAECLGHIAARLIADGVMPHTFGAALAGPKKVAK